jgi:hypothetical protein
MSVLIIILIIPILYVPILQTDFQTERSTGLEKDTVISESPVISGFSENILLSQSDFLYAHHVEPTIAISANGTICAGWKNSETAIGGGARVSVIRSVDGGETWTDFQDMSMFVSKETSRQSDPWLVWGDEAIFYAYLEFSYETNPFSQITVAMSLDYGKTWTPSRATDAEHFADKETMAIDQNGNIFVAYDDVNVNDEEGNSTSKLTRSIDGGLTFTEISVIAPPDPGNVGPYLTVDNFGNLIVAWTWLTVGGGNIFFSRSSDQGTSWDEPVLINADGGYSGFTSFGGRPAKGTLPVVQVDQFDRLYVLFADKYDVAGNSFDIYLRYSDDEGVNWSPRLQVNPSLKGDQWQPDMDIDSEGNLHIVYYDESSDSYRPYYRTLTVSGENRETLELGDVIPIAEVNTSSNFTRPGDYFTVRLDQNDVPHVVWTDGRNDELDIYYAHGVLPNPLTTPSYATTPSSPTSPNTTAGADTTIIPLVIGLGSGFALVIIVALVLFFRER